LTVTAAPEHDHEPLDSIGRMRIALYLRVSPKRILEVAIAVRDGDLFFTATVVRATATDVYVNWRRDHITDWKPHRSYHASGQHHQKSFDNEFLVKKKQQKPNATFNGTKNLVSFGLAKVGPPNFGG